MGRETNETAGTIVVATDGSAASRVAVDLGIELAEALGTTLTFVSVRKPPYPVRGEPHHVQVVGKGHQIAWKAVMEAIARAEQRGIAAEGEVLEGIPAPEIIVFARERNARMIVVGCRGLGAVKGAVLGSVSSAVVHHADRPVFVARRTASLARSATPKIAEAP